MTWDKQGFRRAYPAAGGTPNDRLPVATAVPPDRPGVERVALLRDAQALGARYYAATGKPLGVTGEVAELEAADKLGLDLCPPRTAGYDALDRSVVPPLRVQVKGRAARNERRSLAVTQFKATARQVLP